MAVFGPLECWKKCFAKCKKGQKVLIFKRDFQAFAAIFRANVIKAILFALKTVSENAFLYFFQKSKIFASILWISTNFKVNFDQFARFQKNSKGENVKKQTISYMEMVKSRVPIEF